MFFRREGYPSEGELVLCTVTKVHYNSVFVKLDEFEKTGMIHISEVSPGRIRNLNDFVKESKIIVCKVLKINKEKGHIDLSLRRVTESQKRKKVNELKQEQTAEKIIEFVAREMKKDAKDMYKEIADHVLKEYDMIYQCFEEIVEDNFDLKRLGINQKIADKLAEVVKQRIKPKEVVINGELMLKSYDSDGLDVVKEILLKTEKVNPEFIRISYKGGGLYFVSVNAKEYKEAEEILKKMLETVEKESKKKNVEFEFKRKDKK